MSWAVELTSSIETESFVALFKGGWLAPYGKPYELLRIIGISVCFIASSENVWSFSLCHA